MDQITVHVIIPNNENYSIGSLYLYIRIEFMSKKWVTMLQNKSLV